MTLGEQMLNLITEYQESMDNRKWTGEGMMPAGREPSEIAVDFEQALRSASPQTN